MDVYQKRSEMLKPDNPTIEEIFPCLTDPETQAFIEATPTRTNVVIPRQNSSTSNQQLQLEWFAFERTGSGVWGVHCKPAVYLYPTKKQLVNVKVFPKGELSYTKPLYDKKTGWTVEARPDGLLTTTSLLQPASYPYLYYESRLFDQYIQKPQQGWVVEKSKLRNFFEKTLPQIGLNRQELTDFSDYWLKALPDSPFYFIGLMDKTQRDYLEPLEVTPPPETSIRFSFYFELLDHPKVVNPPPIITPERKGFTLVDWGGMIKLHQGTPFTCSQ